jgi:hypothetical protein
LNAVHGHSLLSMGSSFVFGRITDGRGTVLGRSERAPKRADIPSEKDECLWSGSNHSRDVAHHVAKDVENIEAPNLKIVVGLEITDLELCSRTRSP